MTSPTNDCLSLDSGDIRFYDNFVPTLPVGDYLINVTQQINPLNTSIDECYVTSQPFSVRGPRYTLPPDDVYSIFPPNNAQGIFHQFLPHAVLTKRELPWERPIFGDEGSQQTPWMALLLFAADDATDGTPWLLPPTGGASPLNRTMTATIPASSLFQHATGDGVLWPDLQREWYETDDYLQSTMCSVIDVSPDGFANLVPSKADLRYLAHARQVDPTAKDSTVLRVTGDGWYSVLVGNRLPAAPSSGQAGALNVAHLVSLEGFESYVGGPLPSGTTRVRMISFQSWTFTCLPDSGESFKALMSGLTRDAQNSEKDTTFVLPVAQPDGTDPGADYAYSAIQNGYVPVRYQTRLGEQTFGWYRGPFSPIAVTNFISTTQQTAEDPAGWQPFGTASSALIYDPTYGVFDLSYAVAWETGRLMALSTGYFGQELLDWERKGHRLIDLILERRSQIAALQNFNPESPDPQTEMTLLDQIKPYAFTDDFMTYLVTQFSEQIAPQLYSPSPTVSQPAFPAFPDAPSPVPNPQTIADLLTEADVQQAIRDTGGQELDTIADWLAQLYLLVGVPFENLVPNAALLPLESVRFFYLDSNWLAALIEGALSIGIESSRDKVYQDLMKDLIWNTVLASVQQVRDGTLGAEATVTPPGGNVAFDQQSMTGMLLRSAAVSGWPGLEVNAYADAALSNPIALLRIERLASDVLLCLFPAIPAAVTIDEPREGIAFGFEDPPDNSEGYYLYLRSLDPADYGKPLDPSKYTINALNGIIDHDRRLGITANSGLVPALRQALPNSPAVTVRDFAVEMIKTPEQAVFAPSGTGAKA